MGAQELKTFGADPQERAKVVALEQAIRKGQEEGTLDDVEPECSLRHFFVPRSDEYGCYTYGREITMPKGAVIVGKIHRHPHLNFITRGRIAVKTEFGEEVFEAPVTFVSEPGTKRAVLALEETVWTTVHLTARGSEKDLEEIEAEVIAPTFEALGLSAPEAQSKLKFEVIP